GRSNRTLWTVSTPAPSCRWARNNPSQRCAKRSQNSRSFLSCASAASFLHCCTWSWKKSDVSIIATTTTKAPLTGAPTDQKRTGPVFVPKEKAAYCGRPRRFLEISKLAACSCANCGTQATLTYAALAALLQSLNPKPPEFNGRPTQSSTHCGAAARFPKYPISVRTPPRPAPFTFD